MSQLPPTPLTSDPLLQDPSFLGFMAVHVTTGQEVAWIELRRGPDGAYEVAGAREVGSPTARLGAAKLPSSQDMRPVSSR
jgi:hypothetical protein